MVLTLKTDLHACSIESFTLNDTVSFACGLYELDESTTERNGKIIIYNDNFEVSQNLCMSSGILDMKWSHDYRNLACCLSDEEVAIVLKREEFDFCEVVDNIKCKGEGLILSIDRDDHFNPTSSTHIVVSTQQGSILYYSLSQGGLSLVSTLTNAHQLFNQPTPGWIVGLNHREGSIFFSGGDDCLLKFWDVRTSTSTPSHISKHHSAGVTSGQWHPFKIHEIAVGSYDESISIWDDRKLSQPLHVIGTAGGVWRLKWNPDPLFQNLLLAACMQGGTEIIDFNSSSSSSSNSNALQRTNMELPNIVDNGVNKLNIYSSKSDENNNNNNITNSNSNITNKYDSITVTTTTAGNQNNNNNTTSPTNGNSGFMNTSEPTSSIISNSMRRWQLIDKESTNPLIYGTDWLKTDAHTNAMNIVTCSFYENKINIWSNIL